MKRFLAHCLLILLTSTGSVAAQTYPDPETITVNDFAGLLPPEAETEIGAELDALRDDTGIEFTVVTLSRKDVFAPDQSLEEFAAGLFDQWGIGDKDRNDGILFLVLQADRETRIELGKGYAGEWQFEANWVMEREILPHFKNGDYEAGIRGGVSGTIRNIARPFHAGAAPPDRGSGVSGWFAALLFLPVALMIFWRGLKDRIAAMGRCPNCGQRTLSIDRNTLVAASKDHAGQGEKVTRCSNCDYHQSDPYTISRISRSSSSSSGFGGGSSGGGGASGRW